MCIYIRDVYIVTSFEDCVTKYVCIHTHIFTYEMFNVHTYDTFCRIRYFLEKTEDEEYVFCSQFIDLFFV